MSQVPFIMYFIIRKIFPRKKQKQILITFFLIKDLMISFQAQRRVQTSYGVTIVRFWLNDASNWTQLI